MQENRNRTHNSYLELINSCYDKLFRSFRVFHSTISPHLLQEHVIKLSFARYSRFGTETGTGTIR
ncbi:hypothetical protein J6590_042536 [Homalodisca vitripennis]|nr:hypothetical protein J6590_042536 [Homalodisca vitripennis]